MSSLSINGMLNRAAQSVLDSDRNKGNPLGQHHPHVAHVEVNGGEDEPPVLVVKAGAGPDAARAEFPILGKAIIRPKDRPIAPADCHDAVFAAFVGASTDLKLTLAAMAEQDT